MAQQGSSGRTLSFLLLPLSTGLHIPSAETTKAEGTFSTFEVLFSSLSGTNSLSCLLLPDVSSHTPVETTGSPKAQQGQG